MKKLLSIMFMFCLFMIFTLAACGSDNEQTGNNSSKPVTAEPAASEQKEAANKKALVVFFSMPDNVDDSTVVINGKKLGNTQYMAYVIQQNTDADIFRIEPKAPYTTNHQALVNQTKKEQETNFRPAIKDSIANFDSYGTVFIGYPIWWSDMPMIMYTFFDTYDFSGKTIVPFSTHGGSRFAGTPSIIEQLEPKARMVKGLTISRDDIQEAEQDIINWLENIGYKK